MVLISTEGEFIVFSALWNYLHYFARARSDAFQSKLHASHRNLVKMKCETYLKIEVWITFSVKMSRARSVHLINTNWIPVACGLVGFVLGIVGWFSTSFLYGKFESYVGDTTSNYVLSYISRLEVAYVAIIVVAIVLILVGIYGFVRTRTSSMSNIVWEFSSHPT